MIDKIKKLVIKYIRNIFKRDFYISRKQILLLLLLFTIIFIYIKNIETIKIIIKNKENILTLEQIVDKTTTLVDKKNNEYKSIPKLEKILFTKNQIESWKKLIQIYSISLSRRLKIKNKSILYIKEFNNNATKYKNTSLLSVKMNTKVIPINIQVEIALYLSQFGYIESYQNDLFSIYVTNNSVKNSLKFDNL
jgi:hypothetical protein